MTLRELPIGALHALAIVFYMSTLAAAYCAIRAWGHRAERKTLLFSLLTALVNFVPAGASGRCCQNLDIEPRMLCQQRCKTLTYHTCCTQNSYIILLHVSIRSSVIDLLLHAEESPEKFPENFRKD